MRTSTKRFLIITLSLVLAAFSGPIALADSDGGSGYDIRVLLKGSSSVSHYSVTVDKGEYYIVEADDPDEILATVGAGESFSLSADGSRYGYSCDEDEEDNGKTPYLAIPEDSDCRFSFNGSAYRGGLKVMSYKGYCYAVNVIDVELYLYGVVGREMGYNYHLEALKAQAIAARSHALASISPDNVYYDVTATIASQTYGGYGAESDLIRKAVDKTRGQVILYRDEPAPAFFSSNAGGYTEDIENIWNSNALPLKGVESPYDAKAASYGSYGASCYSWVVEYTPEQVVALANAYGKTDIGSFQSIAVSTSYAGQTSRSGRAMSLTVRGSRDSVTAYKDDIRSLLELKSTLITVSDNTASPASAYVLGGGGVKKAWTDLKELFVISGSLAKMRANGENNSFYAVTADGVSQINKKQAVYDKIVISGKGYGHGVGMSQWGAIAMADNGYDAEEIIEHYYCHNGIVLEELY